MHRIFIQHASDSPSVPNNTLLRKWAKTVLHTKRESIEMTIRIVGIEESADLNATYRHKIGPTNVLSFPFEMPNNLSLGKVILGDLVICADVVNQEAKMQGKSINAHWAHMVVHGIYHLLGYDHIEDKDAEVMEALEIQTMQSLGFPNPYEAGDIKKYDG